MIRFQSRSSLYWNPSWGFRGKICWLYCFSTVSGDWEERLQVGSFVTFNWKFLLSERERERERTHCSESRAQHIMAVNSEGQAAGVNPTFHSIPRTLLTTETARIVSKQPDIPTRPGSDHGSKYSLGSSLVTRNQMISSSLLSFISPDWNSITEGGTWRWQ